jgi:hypothetical protein
MSAEAYLRLNIAHLRHRGQVPQYEVYREPAGRPGVQLDVRNHRAIEDSLIF